MEHATAGDVRGHCISLVVEYLLGSLHIWLLKIIYTKVFLYNLNLINKPNYEDPQILNHKNKFEEWLNEGYVKTNTSFVLKYADITYIKDIMTGI